MQTSTPAALRVFDSVALEKASELGRRNIEPYARARLETYYEYLKTVHLVRLPSTDTNQVPTKEGK